MGRSIDELIATAKEALNVANKKTTEVVNVSKLRMEKLKLSSQYRDVCCQLGQAVYSMKVDNYANEELINSLCSDIDAIRKSIELLDVKIAQETNSIVCPTCGAQNNMENVYCSKCGAKLRETVTYQAE